MIRKRFTIIAAAFALGASMLAGGTTASAAPAPVKAPAVSAPVLANHGSMLCHGDWQCYENFNNCNTADASAGQVGVTVIHRESTSGASTQVLKVRYSASSTADYIVDYTKKTSGGGGTQYWFEYRPVGTNIISSGSGWGWTKVDLPWASFSANPVVVTNFDHTGSTTDTNCTVVLSRTGSVISP